MVADEQELAIPKETLDFFANDEIRARVFYEKYALRDENNNIIEKTPIETWHRVARAIASVERDEKKKEWEDKFYWLLEDFKFIPGGRILFGAGNEKRKVTLINCYYIPIKEDSIEGIFNWCKEAARTYSYGGGVGVDISILRPKGSPVHNAALKSSGSVSFMEIMSETTHTIGQQGRRGALMITIEVSHPDIFDFIKVKQNLTKVRYANISVKVSDEFMRAVENDEEFTLRYENKVIGKIEKKVKAREIWNELIKSAHQWAEPGIIFWDTAKRFSPSEYNGMNVKGTNPCSEQILEDYGACDLGNINLSYFVKDPFTDHASIDWQSLEKTVRYSVRFLDDVLDYNKDKHPLPEQREASMRGRRIGIGFTGLADMLVKLKLRYDSEEALQFVDKLFDFIKIKAYDESIETAKEKGPFPMFDAEKHLSMEFIKQLPDEIKEKIKQFGLRNVAILTVPPVGSGSILAGTSSGIEPIFEFSYIRRSESLSKGEFKVYHPLVKQYMAMFNITDEKDLPSFFVKAYNINPHFRVRMQATIQKHIDGAISSTVNLPSDTSVEEVGNIYMEAWKQGCKGITVYREGSREGILITEDSKKKEEKKENKAEKEKWERPTTMTGKTIKLNTMSGALYVTLNFDENNVPKEVFINLGKTGSEGKSYTEAIGRLISKYLQIGGSIDEVLNSLKGIKSSDETFWDRGVKIYSIPDAIAKAIEIGLGRFNFKTKELASNFEDGIQKQLSKEKDEQNKENDNKENKKNGFEMLVCPKCGEKTLIYENGCYTCKTCGYSKCE